MREEQQDVAGKIQAITQLVIHYGDHIEADLQRYYQVDLLDLYRPGRKLSHRKLSILLSHLPPESATATAIRNTAVESGEQPESDADPADGQWSLQEMLLASVVDELRFSRFEFRQVNTKNPGPAPSQVGRPGVKTKKKRRRNTAITMEQRRRLDPRMRGEWHE